MSNNKDARIINLPGRIAFGLIIAAITGGVFYVLFAHQDEIRTSTKYGYLMKKADYNNLKIGEKRTEIEKRFAKPVGKENKIQSVGSFYSPCTYYIAFEGTTKELEDQKANWGGLPDRTYRLCYISNDTGAQRLDSKTIVGRWKADAIDTPPLHIVGLGKSLKDNKITRVEYDSILSGMTHKEVHEILGNPIPSICDSYYDEKIVGRGYSICYDSNGQVDQVKVIK